jgi:hypothetical protein
MPNEVKVQLEYMKDCKHSIRFQETDNSGQPKKLGSIYVPRETLTTLGWKYGEPIQVTISK